MARVLAIEIGTSKIRICETDYKTKNQKIYWSTCLNTPEGVLNDGEVFVDQKLINVIGYALQANGIKTKQVVFTMNSTKIASREITIPYVKENKVGDVVNANAYEYFPVDLEQYEIAHTVLDTIESGDSKMLKVNVLAIPKTMIQGYYKLAAAIGCSIIAMDYSGNSIYQVMRNYCKDGVQMLLKIDEGSTIITILDEQRIALQRIVSYGAEDVVHALMNRTEFGVQDYDDAVALLRKQDCLSETMTHSISYLVNGISRVIDYYYRSGGKPIDIAYMTGFGGSFLGLAELIEDANEINIRDFREIAGAQWAHHFRNTNFGEYLTCIGAAINPLGFVGQEAQAGKKMQLVPKGQDMDKLAMLVFVAGVVIGVVLAAYSLVNVSMAKSEQKELETKIKKLEEAEDIYEEYLQQQYVHTKMNTFYNGTVTPNDRLVKFIEEMEEKMPSSISVESMEATTESVTLTLMVEDKAASAKVLQAFNTFESIDQSKIGISEMVDKNALMPGEVLEELPVVYYTVEVYYAGVEDGDMNAVLPRGKDAAEDGEAAEEETQTEESAEE